MGFFAKDLGYYDPLDEIVKAALKPNIVGAGETVDDSEEFVEVKIVIDPKELKPESEK